MPFVDQVAVVFSVVWLVLCVCTSRDADDQSVALADRDKRWHRAQRIQEAKPDCSINSPKERRQAVINHASDWMSLLARRRDGVAICKSKVRAD